MKNLVCLLLFVIATTSGQNAKFHVIRQWKYVNFTWPDEESFKTASSKGLYIPENNIIAGVKYFEDYYYITLPRMKDGVPATLTRIKAGPTPDTSPNLEPFPSWEMNRVDDCNNLQNVQNVEIDTRGQIWIIDGGRINTLINPVFECAPKLIIFDIKNNRTNTVYNFPEEIAPKKGSFLYDIVVDNTDAGYAYITDNSANDPGIIVFSVKDNRSWKIRHSPSMLANPSAYRFTVNGITITTPINIAGIALGPKLHTSNDKVVINEAREVYFCPLSSLNLFSINTTTLHNENLTHGDYDYTQAIRNIGVKQSQSVGMIMDNQGILYYGLLGINAIARWDTHTSFDTERRLIGRDEKYIEWPNSFAFDQNGNLTVVVNRLNRFIYDKIDLSGYNFRLISAHVGGKSYLYDSNFNYESESGTTQTPKPEPEPEPSPEPVPSTTRQEHTTSTTMQSTQSRSTVNTTQSSSNSVKDSLLLVILGAILFLTRA